MNPSTTPSGPPISPAPLRRPTAAQLLPLQAANLAASAGSYAFIALAGPLTRALRLDAWQLGFIVAAVGMTWVAAARFWGRRTDARGRVESLRTASIGLCAAYAALCAAVTWMLGDASTPALPVALAAVVLLATRAAMGFFASGIPVAAITWIADHTEPRARAPVMARFALAGSIGMVGGPLIAGGLGRLDLAWALWPFAWLPLLPLLLLGRLGGGIPVTAPRPRPLRIADARIRGPWTAAFSLFSVVIIANLCLGLLLIDRRGLVDTAAAAVAGSALASAGIGIIAAQTLLGARLRTSPLDWLRIGCVLAASGFGSTLLTGPVEWLWLGYLVAGAGMGLAFPAVSALAANTVTPPEQGACAGAMGAAQGWAMVVAPLVGMGLYHVVPELPLALAAALPLVTLLWCRAATAPAALAARPATAP